MGCTVRRQPVAFLDARSNTSDAPPESTLPRYIGYDQPSSYFLLLSAVAKNPSYTQGRQTHLITGSWPTQGYSHTELIAKPLLCLHQRSVVFVLHLWALPRGPFAQSVNVCMPMPFPRAILLCMQKKATITRSCTEQGDSSRVPERTNRRAPISILGTPTMLAKARCCCISTQL